MKTFAGLALALFTLAKAQQQPTQLGPYMPAGK